MKRQDESPFRDTADPRGVNHRKAAAIYSNRTLWDLIQNIFKPSDIEDKHIEYSIFKFNDVLNNPTIFLLMSILPLIRVDHSRVRRISVLINGFGTVNVCRPTKLYYNKCTATLIKQSVLDMRAFLVLTLSSVLGLGFSVP
jgi:hypothetical protein